MHQFILQDQPIRVLGNDVWTPFPVCAGGEIAKYPMLPSLLSKKQDTTPNFLIAHRGEKMSVINAWCDKTNFQRVTILASVDKSVKKKSQYGNMDGFIY